MAVLYRGHSPYRRQSLVSTGDFIFIFLGILVLEGQISQAHRQIDELKKRLDEFERGKDEEEA
jgi:hypothetical protein